MRPFSVLMHALPYAIALCAGTAASAPAMTSQADGPICIARTSGSPETMGADIGAAFAPRIRALVALVGHRPTPDGAACLAHVRPEHRAEITACAQAAGVGVDDLIDAHLIIEPMCSAVAVLPSEGRPLRVARNMDFAPADQLGAATIVQCWRSAGAHAVVGIGWPGFSGIISGMNDAGLCACVLLNVQAEQLDAGEPLPLLLRHVLSRCTTVDEATAALDQAHAGSGHYVLLADARTARLIWRMRDGLHHVDPHDRELAADNDERDDDGEACGERACLLADLAAERPDDASWLRGCLSACYLPGINAQAMLFEPAARRCDLAVGSSTHPAACAAWSSIDLARLFTDTEVAADAVSELPPPPRQRHYTERR